MRMYDIIEKKRRGASLSREEIYFAVNGFTTGDIPDYQMSAFLMAALLRGMDSGETVCFTEAMLASGGQMDLSEFGERTADKHSTGGVGDKTTLTVLPIAASCGAVCAKMSGRGLGHTGGTVDKLESLSGYNTSLTADAFLLQVRKIGIAVVAQTADLVPADKKIYALRDVTATVDSVPLIASSVMSKKLASGARNIVLDVKCGSGAFMKTPEEAKELARAMVSIGKAAGRRTAAYITDMDRVLGCAVGNALEVAEAVDVLRGGGPQDVRELSIALSAEMIASALFLDDDGAKRLAADALDSGRAYAKFTEWVRAQGADFDPDAPERALKKSAHEREIKAERGGYIYSCDCETVGKSACVLGAGRMTKNDIIDPGAGLRVFAKPGDRIARGDTLAVLYTDSPDTLDEAERLFRLAHTVSDEPPEKRPLIFAREG